MTARLTDLQMKTLTNPSDRELDFALAVHVVGWAYDPTPIGHNQNGRYWPPDANKDKWPHGIAVPLFTTDANAVLPWLEKCGYWHTFDPSTGHAGHEVEVFKEMPGGGNYWAIDKTSFPRAAVIALLRANGIEVEFTK